MMKKIFYYILALGLSLSILDLYLNAAEIITPNATHYDTKIGVITKQNKDIIGFNEGFFIGRTNNYGYWGPGYPQTKEKDVIRIALIGDSYIEGLQMFDRDHLRSIIEGKLSENLNRKVEVLKFGFSGFNLENEYCYYMEYIKKFHPDYTLFFIKNPDVYDLKKTNYLPSLDVDTVNKTIKINNSFSNNKAFKKEKYYQKFSGISRILQLAHNDFTLIKKGELLPILLDKFYPVKIKNQESNSEPNQFLSLKAKLTFKSLGKQNGIGIVNLNVVDENILHEIRSNNILYIDPISNLSDSLKHEFFFWKATHRTGHWNQTAHKYIGNYITEKLTPILNKLDMGIKNPSFSNH